MEEKIDSFQRKQLRKTLGIFWPRIIKNEELYTRTNQQPWSVTILKRRMSWLGHLLRLPEQTPARLALEKFISPAKKPIGRPKNTWLELVFNDLRKYSNIVLQKTDQENVNILTQICSNRNVWNRTISSMMLEKATAMH